MSIAERAFASILALTRTIEDAGDLSALLQNLTDLHQLKGALPRSEPVAKEALEAARRAEDALRESFSLGFLANATHLLGEVSRARELFGKATELEGEPLCSLRGFHEAGHRVDLGGLDAAREQTDSNLATCKENEWNHTVVQCHYLLGLLALADSSPEASEHLESVREWADRTGHMEAILMGHHLASEIARDSGDVKSALDEAETGLTLAEGCGFGILAIKLLLSLSRGFLDAPDHRAALGKARDALERSRHKDCRYAWGEADAAHLCGRAHRRLGERDLAKRRFTEALEVRERIEHPGANETRSELEKLAQLP